VKAHGSTEGERVYRRREKPFYVCQLS
jgi:hypothetical protein